RCGERLRCFLRFARVPTAQRLMEQVVRCDNVTWVQALCALKRLDCFCGRNAVKAFRETESALLQHETPKHPHVRTRGREPARRFELRQRVPKTAAVGVHAAQREMP